LQLCDKLDAEKNCAGTEGSSIHKGEIPQQKKMREYTDIVQVREPLVDDVIGFIDGVSFPAECTSKGVARNAMYCSYNCDTMVNNVFSYGPDGKVFFAAIKFPVSRADGSLMAWFLYQMKSKIGNYKVYLNQGFP
jgi:hypothetical protein